MKLDRDIARKRFFTRLVLGWERLWLELAPAGLIAGLFLALALWDLLPGLPVWLHAGLLALLAAGFLTLLFLAWRKYQAPSLREIDRRLEKESGLAHRPLTSLSDSMSGGDALARSLWLAHRRQARRILSALRLPTPRPGFMARDRFFLRPVVFLLLVTAVFAGGHEPLARVERALSPDFSRYDGPPLLIDAWVTPPAHMQTAPFILSAGQQEKPHDIPQGSSLLINLSGGDQGEARLLLDGQPVAGFQRQPDGGRELTYQLQAGSSLAVEADGELRAQWPVRIIPDAAPQVDFTTRPGETERGATRISFHARDDHGITDVFLHLALKREPGDKPDITGRDKEEFPLLSADSEMLRPRKEIETSQHKDLTAHPWAGRQVSLHLAARDQIGQTGISSVIEMALPERHFSHRVARAIVEQRKELIRQEKELRMIRRALLGIAAGPGAYNHDSTVFLSLSVAAARLRYARDSEAVLSVIDLLWDTALRLEDGGLSIAERELRRAQQELMDALNRGAEDEEINRLMDRLRQKMQDFLQALVQDSLKRQQAGQTDRRQLPPDAQLLQSDEIRRLMDQIEELARSDARDAARALLRQLQDMMANLRVDPRLTSPQSQSPEGQAIEELQRLMERQQRLMDETFRRGPQQPFDPNGRNMPGQSRQSQGREGQEASDPLSALAARQEALRRQLGEMMRRYGEESGEIPQSLGAAERAMRQAGRSLQQGEAGNALDGQGQALDQMGRSLRDLMAQQAQQQGEDGEEGGEEGEGSFQDPAGHQRATGAPDNSKVVIPEKSELQKSREILRELRRRRNQPSRPDLERRYIDRLIRQF